MEKDFSQQVERAKSRQAAVIARAETPEVEEHCLGRGAMKFKERLERLDSFLASRELTNAAAPELKDQRSLGLDQAR